MIKVIFANGATKNYRIGCKRLGARSWSHLDYRPCFPVIASIIGVDATTIDGWRVV